MATGKIIIKEALQLGHRTNELRFISGLVAKPMPFFFISHEK